MERHIALGGKASVTLFFSRGAQVTVPMSAQRKEAAS